MLLIQVKTDLCVEVRYILRRTVNLRFIVAAGNAAANMSRADNC